MHIYDVQNHIYDVQNHIYDVQNHIYDVQNHIFASCNPWCDCVLKCSKVFKSN